jgi:hypothetical protein
VAWLRFLIAAVVLPSSVALAGDESAELAALAESADVIALGEVEVGFGGFFISPVATIRVLEPFRGTKKGAVLSVLRWSGPDAFYDVTFLQTGEKVLLFLARAGERFLILGGGRGNLRIIERAGRLHALLDPALVVAPQHLGDSAAPERGRERLVGLDELLAVVGKSASGSVVRKMLDACASPVCQYPDIGSLSKCLLVAVGSGGDVIDCGSARKVGPERVWRETQACAIRAARARRPFTATLEGVEVDAYDTDAWFGLRVDGRYEILVAGHSSPALQAGGANVTVFLERCAGIDQRRRCVKHPNDPWLTRCPICRRPSRPAARICGPLEEFPQ